MSRFCMNLTWADAPHLSEQEKKDYYNSIPAYQRKARSEGIPILGSGLIYPFDEARIKVVPFEIPKHWVRCFGLDSDSGAGYTAIVWVALDRDTQTAYVYKDYKSDSRSKHDHIGALKAQGERFAKHAPLWIPGVGDAKGLLVTDKDSIQVIELYRAEGVDIEVPDKSVTAGTDQVYDLFNVGRLKIFESCSDLLSEIRMYHRVDGKIVKVNDHVCDALRYAIRSGIQRAKVPPIKKGDVQEFHVYDWGSQGLGWLA